MSDHENTVSTQPAANLAGEPVSSPAADNDSLRKPAKLLPSLLIVLTLSQIILITLLAYNCYQMRAVNAELKSINKNNAAISKELRSVKNQIRDSAWSISSDIRNSSR